MQHGLHRQIGSLVHVACLHQPFQMQSGEGVASIIGQAEVALRSQLQRGFQLASLRTGLCLQANDAHLAVGFDGLRWGGLLSLG